MKQKRRESELRRDLEEFLLTLNRDVRPGKAGRIQAHSRTALSEDVTEFRIVDSPRQKPLKKAINIIGPGVKMPDPDDYPRSFRFREFLDFTVNAKGLAESVIGDQRIDEHNRNYIPQSVRRGTKKLAIDARGYFFSEWLSDDKQQLLAVLAPAGHGKTVLTSAITHNLAENYLNQPDQMPFPFFVNFGEFRRLASFDGMILEALQKNGVNDYTSDAFAYLAREGRVVVVLDGFDELLEERPGEAQKNLTELVEKLGGAGKIVVTARDAFFRTSDDVSRFLSYDVEPDQVTVLDLLPFDKKQRERFISGKTKDNREFKRVADFTSRDDLTEAMGSPLLLGETVEILLETADDDQRVNADSRVGLFELLEEAAYDRERTNQAHEISSAHQRQFIELLAKELLEANERGFDRDLIEVAASEVEGDEARKLTKHHFLHAPDDSSEVRFNHQVFREYFQARAVFNACGEGTEGVDGLLGLMRSRPLPKEVGVFLAELDRDGSRLSKLIDRLPGDSASPVLVENVGELCGAYSSREVIQRFIEKVAPDLPFSLRISGVDLSDLDWSGRYFDKLVLSECNLTRFDLSECQVNELTLAECNVEGLVVTRANVGSLSVDYAERVFGSTDVAIALVKLSGEASEANQAFIEDTRASQQSSNRRIVEERLRRFYVPGDTKAASKWDQSIKESTLMGGVEPQERVYVKRKVVPALVAAGVISKRRSYGSLIYDLNQDAEDDARRLIEDSEAVGTIEEALARLAR